MTSQRQISVVDYLRSGSSFHEPHFIKIRNLYQQFTGASDLEDVDESAITKVAHQLNLSVDTEQSRDYLHDCVRYSTADDCKILLTAKMLGEVKPRDDVVLNETNISRPVITTTTTMTNGMIRMII